MTSSSDPNAHFSGLGTVSPGPGNPNLVYMASQALSLVTDPSTGVIDIDGDTEFEKNMTFYGAVADTLSGTSGVAYNVSATDGGSITLSLASSSLNGNSISFRLQAPSQINGGGGVTTIVELLSSSTNNGVTTSYIPQINGEYLKAANTKALYVCTLPDGTRDNGGGVPPLPKTVTVTDTTSSTGVPSITFTMLLSLGYNSDWNSGDYMSFKLDFGWVADV